VTRDGFYSRAREMHIKALGIDDTRMGAAGEVGLPASVLKKLT